MRFHARAPSGVAAVRGRSDAAIPGRRILVIDDDDDVRDALADLLRFLGCSVMTAESAQAARSAIAGSTYDAILCDLAMPRESGVEFMLWLRDHWEPSVRGIPAIAVSAQCSTSDRNEALAAGFVAFIAKPYAIAEIRCALYDLFA